MSSEYFRSLRQGHVIDLGEGGERTGRWIVVSQSCDVVQPKRELLQIAPLVELTDPATVRGAIKKANPRYPIAFDGQAPLFADLASIASVQKSAVENASSNGSAFQNERDAREFGLAVARWFGRFAFPDEVQPWLAPVQELIRDKYDRPSSPLGQVLQLVTEVRVASDQWSQLPLDLTLYVVVKAGVLPTIPEDANLATLGVVPDDLNLICTELLATTNVLRSSVLWAAFADALAERCRPKGSLMEVPEIRSAVSIVRGEVDSEDEFPLSKVRRSEEIDVDFLSDPSPF